MIDSSIHPQIKRITTDNRPTEMVYGIGTSEFGQVLLAVVSGADQDDKKPVAITWLSFIDEHACDGIDLAASMDQMQQYWSGVNFSRDDYYIQPSLNACLATVLLSDVSPENLSLMVHGSDYQLRVWQALLLIPKGETASYKQLATTLGNEKGARAIGGAVGANPISLLIPCHRIIRQDGGLGQYRWGSSIKEKLLSFEQQALETPVYTDGMSGC